MGVSVFVMPLRTWLAGDFRTTWGGGEETASAPRPRRSPEEAERLRDSLLAPLLGGRPDWDESGPAQSATAFSLDAFSLPFLLARRWSYKLKLPNLCALEATQLWIPATFEPVVQVVPPWSDEGELSLASLPRVRSELDRLLDALRAEESPEVAELQRTFDVGRKLRDLAESASDLRMPVIVEG